MPPKFNLEKIKFATDETTFEKAVTLYQGGKVKDFKEEMGMYSATVQGTKLYKVAVSGRYYDQGNCECYLGQNNILCKHMVAVAIYAAKDGKLLSEDDRQQSKEIIFSNNPGELDQTKLTEAKESITDALRFIKYYNGPSKTWFAYQSSLDEGCNRLAKIVSNLPASEQTTKIIVGLLLRLDKKLSAGVDDSDGTVGGFIEEVVILLQEFAKLDPNCIKAFKDLDGIETNFGWEAPLLKLAGISNKMRPWEIK
jgi:hypothetical protein